MEAEIKDFWQAIRRGVARRDLTAITFGVSRLL